MNGRTPYLPQLPLSDREVSVLTDVERLLDRGVDIDQAIGLVSEAREVNAIHVTRLVDFLFARRPELYGCPSDGSER